MKKRTTIYLSGNDIQYIDDYQNLNKKSSRNEALSSILSEHKSSSEIPMQNMYEFISKQIAQELETKLQSVITDTVITALKPQLNSLKYATNATNKDSQILLELINGIYYKESYGAIPSLDSLPTMAYEMSKKHIQSKIENLHYKNSNTVD